MPYRVQLLLKGGEKIASPGYNKRADAEAELAEVAQKLGYHDPLNRPWISVTDALGTIVAASVIETPV